VSLPTSGMLADVTVVELCQALAGPYCGQMLADLGARVIKIEKPGGDDARSMPPYFVGGTSTYFLSVNRGKESLAIDLKADGAAELVLRLIEQADIVIENNRPGVLERLGLAPQVMLARNPSLVVCSITGFGQDGPYRDRGAYDIVVQAATG
jgi:CoA:oxalate CoA-transferase